MTALTPDKCFGSASRIHMNVLSAPFGCHEPKGWLARPEIAMQLVAVSLIEYFGNKSCCILKQMSRIHIIQWCHAQEMCIQDNIIDIRVTFSWDRPLVFLRTLLDK